MRSCDFGRRITVFDCEDYLLFTKSSHFHSERVCLHWMEELFESQMYTTFEDHSAPQGKEQSFITANLKKIVNADSFRIKSTYYR